MFYRLRKMYHNALHHIIGDWNYFLYDEQKHERSIINHYYNQLVGLIPHSTTVIYIANGFCNHAGLCDRLKGITTLYGWCKEIDLDFRVFHVHPFHMEDYLIHNQYVWYVDEKEICYDKRYTSVNHLMLNNLVRELIDSGEVVPLEKEWFKKRTKSHKKQMHFYTNMYPESNEEFGKLFRELFKPAPRLEKEILRHLNNIGGNFISISFRFVQLLGDFKDCDGEILSVEEQMTLIEKSMDVLNKIKNDHPDVHHVLVTADSHRFLDAVKTIPGVYVIDGKVGHINFESSDEVNMKTFLDFFMIAHADKVYLAKSSQMYKSDFARYASMIYNKPFELVLY